MFSKPFLAPLVLWRRTTLRTIHYISSLSKSLNFMLKELSELEEVKTAEKDRIDYRKVRGFYYNEESHISIVIYKRHILAT